MKKRFLFISFLLVAMVLPSVIKSMTYNEVITYNKVLTYNEITTDEEALNFLNSIGNEITLNSADLSNLSNTNYDDFNFFSTVYDVPLELYFNKNNYEYYGFTTIVKSNNLVTLCYGYNYGYGTKNCNGVSKDVKINYANYDKTTYDKAASIIKSFKDEYSLNGMAAINSIYHYGALSDNDYGMSADDTLTDTTLLRFSEIKKVIENNDEFNYKIISYGGGGSPYDANNIVAVLLYKDNILYGYKVINLNYQTMIFIDKNSSGTIYEKVEKKLNEYFNNSVAVSIDKNSATSYGYDLSSDINEILGTNEKYKSIGVDITINNVKEYYLIVEVDGKYVDHYNLRSTDKNTGINISTDSFDVPLDTLIKVQDVLGKNYVTQAKNNNNLNLKYAFDINLLGAYNNKYINTTSNDVDVYIPVSNDYEVGKIVDVYYVKNDSSLGETINGVVEKIDNVLYLHFKTNHFSTYAIADYKDTNVSEKTNNNTEDNPQTSDNILIYGIIGTLSLVGLIGTGLYIRKRFN